MKRDIFFTCEALCKTGLSCSNGTVSPPERCGCGDRARCEAGHSCVMTSPDSGLCVPACQPSTSTTAVLALALCGCNQTLCSPGETCDLLSSSCVRPCENPSLLPPNSIETAGDSTHFLGQQEFECKPGYYMKIKQVRYYKGREPQTIFYLERQGGELHCRMCH